MKQHSKVLQVSVSDKIIHKTITKLHSDVKKNVIFIFQVSLLHEHLQLCSQLFQHPNSFTFKLTNKRKHNIKNTVLFG